MAEKENRNLFSRFLRIIEKVGNALPDPASLFIIAALHCCNCCIGYYKPV
jgi:p-aminobenzoyl-glutamate transporter AbgT